MTFELDIVSWFSDFPSQRFKYNQAFEDRYDITLGDRSWTLLTLTNTRIMAPPPHRNEYTVGWIAPIALELTAAVALLDTSMLDEEDRTLTVPEDDTIYSVGRIGKHYVVMVVCPKMGTSSAAAVVTNMRRSFPAIKHILVVGIAGGVPNYGIGAREQIVLGDIVVSVPKMSEGGVKHYEFGAWVEDTHEARGHTLHPSSALLGAVNNLQTRHQTKPGTRIPQYISQLRENIVEDEQEEFKDPGADRDRLFHDTYIHSDKQKFCDGLCDFKQSTLRKDRGARAARKLDTPVVHYGTIGSANSFMASSSKRNELHEKFGIICFEMEAAGIISEYQGLVIRGICDYSDSHTNKEWQKYAAATAAAYAKELICSLPSTAVTTAPGVSTGTAQSTTSGRRLTEGTHRPPDHEGSVLPSAESLNRADFLTTDRSVILFKDEILAELYVIYRSIQLS